MDLATAADIAASSLRGYQLAADQSNRVADVLALTSAASNASISGLGESMKMVAPIAAGLRIPFEETSAMIGVMADAGIKGSEAGTALRAALLRLSKEPKQTAEALEKLGVATRDANGDLRTMPSLMQSLSEKMADMGKADKMGELSKIFGTEAASGMLALMDAAKTGRLSELTAEIQNAEGAAAAMAERMNATAEGAMKRLSSATESVMIDVGKVLLPVFSEGVEILARFTGKISELAQKFPLVTKVLVGGVAALGAYKIAATGVRIAMTLAKLPFQHVALVLAKVNAWMVLNGETSLLMAAKTRIAAAASKAMSLAQGVLNAVMSANPILLVVLSITALAAGFVLAYQKCEWFRDLVDSALETMKTGWTVWKDAALDALQWVMDKWQAFKDLFGDIKASILDKVDSIRTKFDEVFEPIIKLIEKTTGAWGKLKAAMGFDEAVASGPGRDDFSEGIAMLTRMKQEKGLSPEQEKQLASWKMLDAQQRQQQQQFEGFASGGIFTKPQFGLFAEAGPESIIPHNPGGEKIWRATGEMAGFSAGMPGGVSFSPSISLTVQTAEGADGNAIGRQILSVIEPELPRLLKRFSEQQARVSY
jgi:TP901 family phage tail tape measure protein